MEHYPDQGSALRAEKNLTGAGRRGRMLSPQERKRAAYHESGHVIVAAATGRFDEVHRVSILTTGRNVGSTEIRRQGDAAVLTTGQLRGRLLTLLAGLASEELVFSEGSTGSEKDLDAATKLARDMIGRYGMSEKLGRARLLGDDVDEFLDAEISLGPVSGQTHHDVDVEIRRLLDEAEQEATRLLVQHRKTLDLLAARLETEETLEGPDLDAVLAMVRPEVELFGGMLSGGDGSTGQAVGAGDLA